MEKEDPVGQFIFGSLQNDAPDRGHSDPAREEDGRTSRVIVESQVTERAFDFDFGIERHSAEDTLEGRIAFASLS